MDNIKLVHAGLANFSQDKNLNDYGLYDFLEERADHSKRYCPDENTSGNRRYADNLYRGAEKNGSL